MSGGHRMSFEKHGRLDSPDRLEFQPVGPLVDLAGQGSPSTVLDLGAGIGYFTIPLARRFESVVALDVEPRMLEKLRTRAEQAGVAGRIRTLPGVAEKIPLQAGSVDLVLMTNLYHELDDRSAALAEARRVLAAGGRIIVCDWDPGAPGEKGPPRDHRIDPEIARTELERAGFGNISTHRLYRDFYLLSADA